MTKSHEEVAAKQADFGVSFFKSLSKESNYENIVVSPFSMSLDLAMLATGATGNTYSELVSGLGFEGLDPERIGEYYSAIIKENTLSLSTVFKTANALWVNTSSIATVKESYIEEAQKLYDASVERYNFSKDPIKAIINEWSNENTNALYFKGHWVALVPYEKTSRKFKDIKGHNVKCDFFTGKVSPMQGYNTKWEHSGEAALLSLNYGDGFRMNVILPPAGERFEDFVKSLSAEYIRSLFYKQAYDRVDLDEEILFYLPSFKIEYGANDEQCRAALNDVGIKRIYSSNAEFGKISAGIFVDKVIQKAIIDVNEIGTEAAAVTYIETTKKLF